MEVQVKLVKAFTKDKDKGNPAGVVLDSSLSKEQMHKVLLLKLGFPLQSLLMIIMHNFFLQLKSLHYVFMQL